jgi:hypothetical protein
MLYVYGSGSVSQFKTIHAILLHVTRGRTDKTGQSNNGSAKQEEGGNERGEEADLYLIDCLINFSNATGRGAGLAFSHGSKCLTGTCLRSEQRCHASTAARLFACA